MSEVKLLTEAQWRERLTGPCVEHTILLLQEQGLIAPEPVDPLLVEAGKICERHFDALGESGTARQYRPGGRYHNESDDEMTLALAALRRGMELQREATNG